MNKLPLVSVLVATYNGQNYIIEQLESIYNQTYANQEIVIVDDGSKDETLGFIRRWIKNKENVFLHAFKENVGYTKNFARCIKLCKGNYISFADQDDVWILSKTEKLMNRIGNKDLVYCNSAIVDEALTSLNKSFKDNHHMISSNDPLNFLIRNSVSGHAMIFKRDLLKEQFEFPLYITHDRWVAFLAASRNGVVYVDDTLVKYRIHAFNALGGKKRVKKDKNDQIVEASEKIKSLYEVLPEKFFKEKRGLQLVYKSYQNNTFINKLRRMSFYISNYHRVFKIPKRPRVKKIFYAFTMFNKIR